MGPIEKTDEFDATIYTAEFVTVEVEEALASVLERVEEAWMRSPNVVLVIPRASRAFGNTHDFLALGKLPGARQVRVSVASPDPTIAGLARLLGFHIVDLPPDHPAVLNDPMAGALGENDIEQPTSPLPLGRWGGGGEWVVQHAAPVPLPKRDSLITSTWLAEPSDYEAPGAKRDVGESEDAPVPLVRARQTDRLSSTNLAKKRKGGLEAPEDPPEQPGNSTPALRHLHVSPTPSGRIKARSVMVPDDGKKLKAKRGIRWGIVVASMLGVLIASLVGGFYYAFTYLPEATVTVTPRSKVVSPLPIEIPVLLDSAPSGGVGLYAPSSQIQSSGSRIQNGPTITGPSVKATHILKEIVEEGTIPSSGTRQVAKGRAKGTMSFVNREPVAVSVPAGTQFRSADGVVVQVVSGGTVPATVFGQKFGELSLPISALADGPDGNLAAGKIAGLWKGMLEFYSSEMDGGGLETIKFVTQDDIETLSSQLRKQAESKYSGLVALEVGAGQRLITQTVVLTNVVVVADRTANEDATEVKVKLTAEARGAMYSEAQLQDAVVQAILDYVGTTEPKEYGSLPDMSSINFEPPALQAFTNGQVVYGTSGTVRVDYKLLPPVAEQIRDLVKGKEVRKAQDEIAVRYGTYISLSGIEAKVLWFTVDKLPADAERISVGVGGP